MMTAPGHSQLDHPANLAAFETTIAGALRVVAALQYGPSLRDEPGAAVLVLEHARELERHASEITLLDSNAGTDVLELGSDWYARLIGGGFTPLAAAYEAVHAAAYLGLGAGTTCAMMLAAVACALRDLCTNVNRQLN